MRRTIRVRRADVMHYRARQCKGIDARNQAVSGPPPAGATAPKGPKAPRRPSRQTSRLSCGILRGGKAGAGEGNRTLVFSLEGCCSTIELHPRNLTYYTRNPPLRDPDGFANRNPPCRLGKAGGEVEPHFFNENKGWDTFETLTPVKNPHKTRIVPDKSIYCFWQ